MGPVDCQSWKPQVRCDAIAPGFALRGAAAAQGAALAGLLAVGGAQQPVSRQQHGAVFAEGDFQHPVPGHGADGTMPRQTFGLEGRAPVVAVAEGAVAAGAAAAQGGGTDVLHNPVQPVQFDMAPQVQRAVGGYHRQVASRVVLGGGAVRAPAGQGTGGTQGHGALDLRGSALVGHDPRPLGGVEHRGQRVDTFPGVQAAAGIERDHDRAARIVFLIGHGTPRGKPAARRSGRAA
jgi:hypothetical protein